MTEPRQITLEEWNEYEWVEVTTPADKYPIYLRGVRNTTSPTVPNDGMKYIIKDTTTFGGRERNYFILPLMTYD